MLPPSPLPQVDLYFPLAHIGQITSIIANRKKALGKSARAHPPVYVAPPPTDSFRPLYSILHCELLQSLVFGMLYHWLHAPSVEAFPGQRRFEVGSGAGLSGDMGSGAAPQRDLGNCEGLEWNWGIGAGLPRGCGQGMSTARACRRRPELQGDVGSGACTRCKAMWAVERSFKGILGAGQGRK